MIITLEHIKKFELSNTPNNFCLAYPEGWYPTSASLMDAWRLIHVDQLYRLLPKEGLASQRAYLYKIISPIASYMSGLDTPIKRDFEIRRCFEAIFWHIEDPKHPESRLEKAIELCCPGTWDWWWNEECTNPETGVIVFPTSTTCHNFVDRHGPGIIVALAADPEMLCPPDIIRWMAAWYLARGACDKDTPTEELWKKNNNILDSHALILLSLLRDA